MTKINGFGFRHLALSASWRKWAPTKSMQWMIAQRHFVWQLRKAMWALRGILLARYPLMAPHQSFSQLGKAIKTLSGIWPKFVLTKILHWMSCIHLEAQRGHLYPAKVRQTKITSFRFQEFSVLMFDCLFLSASVVWSATRHCPVSGWSWGKQWQRSLFSVFAIWHCPLAGESWRQQRACNEW